MYASAKDYLKPLRKGGYLQFAQLLTFIINKYQKEGEVLDQNQLTPLCIFELINAGITKEDARHIRYVYALSFSESVPETTRYACTTLATAMIEVLAILNHLEEEEGKTKSRRYVNMERLEELSQRVAHDIAEYVDEIIELAPEQQAEFHEIKTNIHQFYHDSGLFIWYYQQLEQRKTLYTDHKDFMQRLEIVTKINEYLAKQTKYHAEAKNKVMAEVVQLKTLNPEPWEIEHVLNKIVAPTMTESVTEALMYGAGFVSKMFSLS